MNQEIDIEALKLRLLAAPARAYRDAPPLQRDRGAGSITHWLSRMDAMQLQAMALPAIAKSFLNVVMAPTSIALYRVIVAEAARFPELGRVSYENGPAFAINNLAAYLEEQARLGQLSVPDPVFAAEQFFSLLLGYVHIRALFGIEPSPQDPTTMAKHIEANVRTFLDAYGRAGGLCCDLTETDPPR